MAFEINFSKQAAKEFKKLDIQVQKRIFKKLTEYSLSESMSDAKRLSNPVLGEWRYRMGDYRVIFDKKGKEIQILKVAHRSEVYE